MIGARGANILIRRREMGQLDSISISFAVRTYVGLIAGRGRPRLGRVASQHRSFYSQFEVTQSRPFARLSSGKTHFVGQGICSCQTFGTRATVVPGIGVPVLNKSALAARGRHRAAVTARTAHGSRR